jgi:hypothetical protein
VLDQLFRRHGAGQIRKERDQGLIGYGMITNQALTPFWTPFLIPIFTLDARRIDFLSRFV